MKPVKVSRWATPPEFSFYQQVGKAVNSRRFQGKVQIVDRFEKQARILQPLDFVDQHQPPGCILLARLESHEVDETPAGCRDILTPHGIEVEVVKVFQELFRFPSSTFCGEPSAALAHSLEKKSRFQPAGRPVRCMKITKGCDHQVFPVQN